MEIKYVPLITLDNKYLYTSNDLEFNVKQYADGYFSITLYKSTAEEHRVDKTNYLTQVGELGGILRDTTSLINIAIEIEYKDVPNFNYVYISKFNRYYYVTDITSIRTNIWEISLSIDVLMSYKNGLLNLKGFIDRNEFTFDSYLDDKKRVIQEGYTVESDFIQNNLFTNNGSYVLTGLTLSNDDERIAFYFNNVLFYAFVGQKWVDWIMSPNASFGFNIDDSGYITYLNRNVYDNRDVRVYKTSTITELGVYYSEPNE